MSCCELIAWHIKFEIQTTTVRVMLRKLAFFTDGKTMRIAFILFLIFLKTYLSYS